MSYHWLKNMDQNTLVQFCWYIRAKRFYRGDFGFLFLNFYIKKYNFLHVVSNKMIYKSSHGRCMNKPLCKNRQNIDRSKIAKFCLWKFSRFLVKTVRKLSLKIYIVKSHTLDKEWWIMLTSALTAVPCSQCLSLSLCVRQSCFSTTHLLCSCACSPVLICFLSFSGLSFVFLLLWVFSLPRIVVACFCCLPLSC